MKKTSKFLLGAGVSAAVAAGVLAFLTQNPKGKKMLKDGKKHLAEITNLVVRRSEQLSKISKVAYEHIVDEVVTQYQEQKNLSTAAADELAAQLKKEWNAVKRELQKK